MNAQNIGRLTYYISVDEASGEVAPKPGSEYKLLDIENASSDEISALGEDITKYYYELSLKDPLVNAVYSLIDASGSSNGDYDDSFSWDDDDSFGWDDDDHSAGMTMIHSAGMTTRTTTAAALTGTTATGTLSRKLPAR